MNNFKKTGGFTLVELIVVIAILGILAAVAVPAYSGYITKAHEAADITQLDAIKTAALATMAEEGGVTEIELGLTSGTVSSVLVNGTTTDIVADDDFVMYYGSDTMPTMQIETYKDAASIHWYATEVDTDDDGSYSTSSEHPAGWVAAASST